jgi:hypothetical protein
MNMKHATGKVLAVVAASNVLQVNLVLVSMIQAETHAR